jgi:hypothetical protein
MLHAYEIKWKATKIPKLSKSFSGNYPNPTFTVINPDNYWQLLLEAN